VHDGLHAEHYDTKADLSARPDSDPQCVDVSLVIADHNLGDGAASVGLDFTALVATTSVDVEAGQPLTTASRRADLSRSGRRCEE